MAEPIDPVGERVDDGGADDQVDTSQSERDPLSTDDGLAEVAAAGMPETETEEDPNGEDALPDSPGVLLDNPGLDVTDDGVDPCAELGHCAADEGA